LTREALSQFLSHLDGDPDKAGEKYEAIRLRRVKFFDWRGAHFPDQLADETINRVIRKLESGEALQEIELYCLGVARLVFLESLRAPDFLNVGLEQAHGVASVKAADPPGERHECFSRCLGELPLESRQLIFSYYKDDRRVKIDNRQALADRLGIPLNALRSRAQRIRNRLERCIEDCLG
jgi:DNA-directed RNA polymerase specialized sigma24 family protein